MSNTKNLLEWLERWREWIWKAYVAKISPPLTAEEVTAWNDLRGIIKKHDSLFAENVALRSEVDKLARFIMEYIHGEPSQSESAVDTIIRIMTTLGKNR